MQQHDREILIADNIFVLCTSATGAAKGWADGEKDAAQRRAVGSAVPAKLAFGILPTHQGKELS